MGGLSLGFRDSEYVVTGVDVEPASREIFQLNGIGTHILKDLATEMEIRDVPLVAGGPPCRPWSSVNQQRRGDTHADHRLLRRFFLHVLQIAPRAFLMENVPPLLNDAEFRQALTELGRRGYSVESRILRYSEFGAATSRRRLFTFGIRDPLTWGAQDFFELLDGEKAPERTVEQAIGYLRDAGRGDVPDHDWSELKTIGKYRERYRSGQFGWTKLRWDAPAPSFGSIAKTYILHPDSDVAGKEPRVLSVREVLEIMGFADEFQFPPGTARNRRYRMVANAVPPVVSSACARVIRQLLWREEPTVPGKTLSAKPATQIGAKE